MSVRSLIMEKSPHFSRVADIPEVLNPITGRSMFYGLRPWRCDDRFNDWLVSAANLANPKVQFHALKLFYQCAKSEYGKEPIDDYMYLTRKETMYYVERKMCGMMRDRLFETYPYDQDAVKRISEEDALKMRVWRHQRELELEAKEGKIDELLAANVLGSARSVRPSSKQ